MRTALARLVVFLLMAAPTVLAQLPEAARRKLVEAVELASSNRLEDSESVLRGLEKQYPGDGEVKYRLGLVLLRQGKLPEAGDRLESAVELMSESPHAWLAVARTRLKDGRNADAREAIAEANRLAPNEPFVWRASAMFFEEAGDFDAAACYEVKWFEAQPRDKVSRLRAMEYFIRADQADPAIELGLAALADENLAVTHNLLGRAYRLKRDPAKAVDELQAAVRLDPDVPSYYTGIAQLFLDHNTPEPALMILEQASQRFPRDLEVLRQYGLARYAAGDHARALECFLKITGLAPDAVAGYASLETLLPYAEDQLTGIIRKLRGLHERHPSNPLAPYLLAMALKAQSRETPESQRVGAVLD